MFRRFIAYVHCVYKLNKAFFQKREILCNLVFDDEAQWEVEPGGFSYGNVLSGYRPKITLETAFRVENTSFCTKNQVKH